MIAIVLLAAVTEAGICVPGRQLSCACPGGERGAQHCQEDGASFSECQCRPPETPAAAAARESAANPSLFAFVLGGGVAIDRPAMARCGWSGSVR